ncbi:hypothetical protein PRIPAC_95672 [Pristionchus pacificus]|uniref:Uncharacterized protein n=1 Tax=Pristionchus pacificus TaxID=54126 RepID=A0A2A6BD51_PRIPA|nr:hypothetical protein PRIPAC_95672 [Pristionchus pacificus]|eukprot:PDM63761.1 hypothetical protein PRIPAC_49734 [Pristionchus pacificus]
MSRQPDDKYNGLNDESANVVSEDEASLYEYDIDHIEVHAVELIPEVVQTKCLIQAGIGTTPIELELDKGSAVSVIGYQTWEALGSPSLQDTHRAAKAYGGQLLRFRGVLQAEVKWGSKQILTRLFVLTIPSPSIWGRESIQKFEMDLGSVYRHGIQRAAEVKGRADLSTRDSLDENARILVNFHVNPRLVRRLANSPIRSVRYAFKRKTWHILTKSCDSIGKPV